MTVYEFQEKYPTPKGRKEALAKMTDTQVREIIDSCGIVQCKIYYKELYTQAVKERDNYLHVFCETYDEKMTIEEYKTHVIRYLTLCPYRYSESFAEKLAEHNKKFIEQAYKNKETIGDIAVDIGFFCG